jgi:anti-sigma regulatory factor (Ser/Thr protein kinase)
MSDPPDFRVVFPGGEKAAGRARRALGERLAGVLSDDRMDDLLLLATEIVANSVRHGGVGEDGEIDLRVRVLATVVRVELRDTGIQVDPRVRAPDFGGGGGFGMVLVERMSERWGVDHEPTVVMWFELSRTSPRPSHDAHSLALNSQIAMPSITSPRASTTSASSPAGTCQPHHVTPGSSARRAAALMSRCENTSRRIGSTA